MLHELSIKVSPDPDLAYAIPAQINGNTFFVNNLPLAEGVNTITAIATDADGNIAKTSIVVTSDTVGQSWLDLSLIPENGAVDPGAGKTFQATLRVTPHLQNQPGSTSWSYGDIYSGSGTSPDHYTLDSSSADGMEHQLTFYDQGIYTFYFTLYADTGQEYTGELMVNVIDADELDVSLKAKWNNVASAFASNNIEGGLSFFVDSSKERYRTALNAIANDSATHLSDMFSNLPDIQRVYAWEDRVKYRIKRVHDINGSEVTATYYIYFVKDIDGIWRIEQF